jgi:hypothetical protein
MPYIYNYLYQYPYLALALGTFTALMAYDAYCRRCDHHWYWLIVCVPLIGPLVYFFTVMAPGLHQTGFGSLFQRRASLEELRYRADQMPTLTNQLELAERLIEKGEYAIALPPLEAALKREPDHNRVLYGLALCHTRLGHPEKAFPYLDNILRRDQRWSDYDAWQLLIEARRQVGDGDGALESCRDLVKSAPTLRHRCLLAELLLDRKQTDEAREILERGLQDHSYHPGPIRRRNRHWAGLARRLHKRAAAR